ncbi:hypothetical protein [Shewanella chilikensis]|uniref:hypothetical protein n=1 Tax=Shewanella chilikensis TaxID=558541 RepID=UPI00399B0652
MKVTYQAAAKAQQPTRDQGLKVDYAPAKRGGMKWRWYLLLLLVIAPVVLLLWVLLRPSLFVLAPGILTSEPLEMRAMQKGQIIGAFSAAWFSGGAGSGARAYSRCRSGRQH